MNTRKHQIMAGLAGAVITVGLGASALTFAQTNAPSSGSASTSKPMGMPGVGGTVTAVSGNTVTITGKNGTSYTIDASAAAITKEMSVSISSIAVGDTVMAEGTVNGTNVTATSIRDGKMPEGGFGGGRGHGGMEGGRGVHGTVSAISGNTLTITSTNPQDSTTKTYTVDASSATVLKSDGTTKPAASTLSAVAVGDSVMVNGSISGTSVTAKTIVDGAFPQGGHRGTKSADTTAQ